MFSIYLFFLSIQYNCTYFWVKLSYLIKLTLAVFIIQCIIKITHAITQQQVYEVLEKKSFANIYSGITSYKTLLELRLEDKFGNI